MIQVSLGSVEVDHMGSIGALWGAAFVLQLEYGCGHIAMPLPNNTKRGIQKGGLHHMQILFCKPYLNEIKNLKQYKMKF